MPNKSLSQSVPLAQPGRGCCGGGETCCGAGHNGLTHASTPLARPLSSSRIGDTGIICHHQLDRRDAELLRAMGLRPRARVRICKLGDPCIVEVLAGCGHGGGGPEDACSCRIGLAGPLAGRVMIDTAPLP